MLKTFTAISSGLPGCVGEVKKSGNFTLCVTRSNFSVVAHASADSCYMKSLQCCLYVVHLALEGASHVHAIV